MTATSLTTLWNRDVVRVATLELARSVHAFTAGLYWLHRGGFVWAQNSFESAEREFVRDTGLAALWVRAETVPRREI